MSSPVPLAPWAIGGGVAKMSAEHMRTLAYYAVDAKEGVLEPPHLHVRQFAIPGEGVRVMPGVIAVHSGYNNQPYQTYVDFLSSAYNLPVPANAEATTRYDLITWQFFDPHVQGSPDQPPTDPVYGRYGYPVLWEDLSQYIGNPAAVKHFSQLEQENQTAYALSLLALPGLTGTVLDEYLTDLRGLSKPVVEDEEDTVVIPASDILDSTFTSWAPWPANATWTREVPEWATHVHLTFRAQGALEKSGVFVGEGRPEVISSVPGYELLPGKVFPIRTNDWGFDARGRLGPFELDQYIVPQLRGKTVTLRLAARWTSGDGEIEVDPDTTFTMGIKFRQEREPLSFWDLIDDLL